MRVSAVMKPQTVLILLISTVSVSSSQSCGSSNCSQDYDSSCPPDEFCHLYHNCKTSKSKCDGNMGPADAQSVDCYDTCIVGHPIDPSIPFKCCADQRLVSEAISITPGEGYLVARLYSPNEPGLGVYRHNTFCKYNIQCPSNDHALYYTMVRFDIEPTLSNGKCLDFLRYHFTATGASVDADACGKLGDLNSNLKSGVHGSSLTLDFRSNRLNRRVDFFLVVACIKPNPTQATGRGKRATRTSLSLGPLSSDLGPSAQLTDCTPTMSYDHKTVQNVQKSSTWYLNRFNSSPRMKLLYMMRRPITVTRSGVVIYRDNTIYVKIGGKIRYRFRNIRMLYVKNKIEGYLRFIRNASPQTRVFPGYGFLQVGSRFARYYQTIVNPRFLLSDKEQMIVRDLYNELYNRNSFDAERFYFKAPSRIISTSYEKVNCSINELAELNSRSCTDVVRAAANFFLKKDTFQKYCREGY